MMKTSMFTTVLFLFFIMPAEGSDWQFVTRTETCTFFVDTDSIKSAGRHIAKAWTKMSYDTPKQNQKLGKISYMVKKIEYDCMRDRIRYHERTFFGEQENVLYESKALSPWKGLLPDTALMNLHRFVCVSNWDFP